MTRRTVNRVARLPQGQVQRQSPHYEVETNRSRVSRIRAYNPNAAKDEDAGRRNVWPRLANVRSRRDEDTRVNKTPTKNRRTRNMA